MKCTNGLENVLKRRRDLKWCVVVYVVILIHRNIMVDESRLDNGDTTML